MPEPTRCWVCHRSAAEIQASLDAETQEESEIKKQISQVTWFRSKFLESASVWRKSIPKEFKDMDFLFVTNNADQFRSVEVLGELLDAKKLMMDWLADTSERLRKDEGGSLGTMAISSMDKSERESLIKIIDQFEARYHRYLMKDGESRAGAAGYANGFENLKLAEGLEYLVAGGLLYYDFQSQMLAIALTMAAATKPKWSVELVGVQGNPKVAMCNVCQSLIKELRVPSHAEARPQEPSHEPDEVPSAAEAPALESSNAAEEPKEREEPQLRVEEAPQAPVQIAANAGVSPAQEAAQEVPEASPQFAEIVKKIGPATKEHSPRGRFLHEHRLKEDWDETVKGTAEADGA